MPHNTILKFNGQWRSYQQRILDSLDFHLRDKKLHVVAAPGAGKTTLSIEVIARIKRPTLILCPTNTIKNQWRERICSSFLKEKDYGIVSTSIRQPGFLTVTTYQALLAALCGQPEEGDTALQVDENHEIVDDGTTISHVRDADDYLISSARFRQDKADEIIAILKAAKVSLLCFDEAHHLRNEWWKALTYLNEHLKPEQTLALTATPPYDANYVEWKRYQELCGEIDEVISIPELVKNGDLCPHQDYIYFAPITQSEKELLDKQKQNVGIFVDMIQGDKELLDALSKMKFFENAASEALAYQADDSDIEMIFESSSFYVAIASLLNANGYRIPSAFLALFDAKQKDLPKFDIRQASSFIKGFIESKADCFKPLEQKKFDYYNAARRLGLVVNKKVVFDDNIKIRRLIAGSVGKLGAIVDIVRLESSQLHGNLRMVILTDYIRMDDIGCQSLGVVPIWRKLKNTFGSEVSIGVLCGSLILLPENKVIKLHKLLSDNDINEESVTVARFDDDDRFVRVTPKESLHNSIVRIMTELFCCGDLTVLIGTQALLGEGWDAPSINSLILSSTVSSYMLSNQMRGRAIRIDKNNPDKVSNIWHLATVGFDYDFVNHDIEQLAARFKGFEAPSYYGKHEILSGIERVVADYAASGWYAGASPAAFPSPAFLKDGLAKLEAETRRLASNRELISRWWKESLYLGYGNDKRMNLTTGVQVPRMTTTTLLYTGYKYKVLSFLSVVTVIYLYLLGNLPPVGLTIVTLLVVAVFLSIIAVNYIRTGTVEGIIKQIAITILEAMSSQGLIKSSIKNVGLRVTENNGMLFVSCANLPAEENNIFIQALEEFLGPVEKPRYLLIKHDKYMGRIRQTDYFSVPSVLSANKQGVEIFKSLWEKYIGACDIVYTRNLDGRKLLLKARREASSSSKRQRTHRLSKWQ